jgi:hypothetical protein
MAGPPSKVEVHWIRKLLDSSEYALMQGVSRPIWVAKPVRNLKTRPISDTGKILVNIPNPVEPNSHECPKISLEEDENCFEELCGILFGM